MGQVERLASALELISVRDEQWVRGVAALDPLWTPHHAENT